MEFPSDLDVARIDVREESRHLRKLRLRRKRHWIRDWWNRRILFYLYWSAEASYCHYQKSPCNVPG